MIFLFPIRTAAKIPRLKLSSFVDPHWPSSMGQFKGYCLTVSEYRSQFEQSLAVVRVGWNFKSFFLTPTAPGGAFPVERSGFTTASGTPNLITAFTSPVLCVHGLIGGTKNCLQRPLLESSLMPQQAIARFR
jgi:hypothetical protein